MSDRNHSLLRFFFFLTFGLTMISGLMTMGLLLRRAKPRYITIIEKK